MNNVEIFKSYFDAFEATFADDNWDRIAPFFAEDMVYNTSTGETIKGREAALQFLKAELDNVDRRFDARAFNAVPNITGEGNTVTLNFAVRYEKSGVPDLNISGKEIAIFQNGQIQRMDDLLSPQTLAELPNWMTEHGASIA